MESSNPTTTPTIAELWGNLQTMSITGNPCTPWTYEWHEWQSALQDLRAQLIERCKRVRDVDGFTSMFEIEERNGQLGISIYFQDRRGYSSRHPRCDDANTAKEYAAAYAFWAWELDQRQNESQP